MWDKTKVLVGDNVLADNDTDWGVVRGIQDDGVVAYYSQLDDNYLIMWCDIDSVRRNGFNVDPNEPAPTPASASAMVADGIDVDAQRKIEPGHIIVWSEAKRFGYDPNRMFVILNFTKNSQKTQVNIHPLNGAQPGEGRGDTDNLGWYKAQVKNCTPIAFGVPLIMRKAGA